MAIIVPRTDEPQADRKCIFKHFLFVWCEFAFMLMLWDFRMGAMSYVKDVLDFLKYLRGKNVSENSGKK